jgi:hypothetical protein
MGDTSTPQDVQQGNVRILEGSASLADNLTAPGKKNSVLFISGHYDTRIFYINYHITRHPILGDYTEQYFRLLPVF